MRLLAHEWGHNLGLPAAAHLPNTFMNTDVSTSTDDAVREQIDVIRPASGQ